MKKQSPRARGTFGGTLIGFVIGLLVGLGVALAVAVYVTRVPIPFVDRGVSRKPDLDAIEAERNKGWNPNGAFSRSPAAAGGAAATPPGTDPSAGAISVPPADGRPLPAPTPGAGSDPLGDLVQSRLGQPPSSAAPTRAPAPPAATPASASPSQQQQQQPPPGADPFSYFVQAGAFRTPEDAEAQRAKLAMLGFDAAVTEREQSGRTMYRVRVGPFGQRALAALTKEQLEVNGIEAALVSVQR